MAETISFRPNEDDKKNISFLRKRLGLSFSSVIRLAVKRLYDAEKKSAG